jgi:hypothetical protein
MVSAAQTKATMILLSFIIGTCTGIYVASLLLAAKDTPMTRDPFDERDLYN